MGMRGPLGAVLAGPDGEAALDVLMRYLAATHRKMSREKVGELLEQALGPRGRKMKMTWIDELEAKRAELEGKLEGARDVAQADRRAVRRAVPARVEARVRRAGEAELGRWSVRVLTATSASAVVGVGAGRARPAAARADGRVGTVARRG